MVRNALLVVETAFIIATATATAVAVGHSAASTFKLFDSVCDTKRFEHLPNRGKRDVALSAAKAAGCAALLSGLTLFLAGTTKKDAAASVNTS